MSELRCVAGPRDGVGLCVCSTPLYLWFLHPRVSQPYLENCFGLLSVAVIKTLTKSNLWEARMYFTYCQVAAGHGGTSGQEPEPELFAVHKAPRLGAH